MPALLAVSLLTVSLFLDTFLSRIDGVVMLTGLVIVMIWLVRLGIRSAANDPIKMDYEAEIPDGCQHKGCGHLAAGRSRVPADWR